MTDVTETEKLVVLSAISVAIESSKLWHNVYSDPDHILHGIHLPTYFSENEGNRKLQGGGGGGGGGSDQSTGSWWWGDEEEDNGGNNGNAVVGDNDNSETGNDENNYED